MKYFIVISIFLGFVGFFYPKKPPSFESDQLIIWNVGQGQMVTYLSKTHCFHFDMGGEKFPEKKLFNTCRKKKNEVRYTHWDHDHINFSLKAKRILPSLCRVDLPSYRTVPDRKKWILKKIPLCLSKNNPHIINIPLPKKSKPKNSNESSLIFIVKNKVLIPGDSTQRMEPYWAPQIQNPINILITGHHGSRYSTSWNLLKHLPDLKLAVSSARKKRYGHPHQDTVKRLRKKGVPLIQTEYLGHIRIPLDSPFPKALPF